MRIIYIGALVAALTALGATEAKADLTPYQRLHTCGRLVADAVNEHRAEVGRKPLRVSWSDHWVAVRYSRSMAESGVLRHSARALAGEYGENVGTAPDYLTLIAAWRDSQPHLANERYRGYTTMGPGCAVKDGRVWGTVVFR